jgi:DNA-directed RNA polymerase subunit RPC12/RpoP
MTEVKTFNCPSCGAAVVPAGSAAEIACQYCGRTMIVPEELRAPVPIGEAIGVSPSTTRWVKIGVWGFVILMIVSFVLPFVCSLCGVVGSLAGVFVPFLTK